MLEVQRFVFIACNILRPLTKRKADFEYCISFVFQLKALQRGCFNILSLILGQIHFIKDIGFFSLRLRLDIS
jgi:hypothetical protein